MKGDGSMCMRAIILGLILATYFPLVVSAQDIRQLIADRMAKLEASSTDPSAKLITTLEVVDQQYCSPTELLLRFRVTYRNVGSVPILLYKKDKVGYAWTVTQIKGKMTKGYTMRVEPMFELGSLVRGNEDPAEEEFSLLKPGEAMSSPPGGISLTLNDRRGGDDDDGLRNGTFSLKLKTMSWYYSYSLVEPYFQKWKDKGALWWKDVTSEPMIFSVTKKYSIGKCESLQESV